MRTIRQLPNGTPINTDFTNFPDGGLVNETTTVDGTPVVEDIYGDVLVNLYALMRKAGIVPNGTVDKASTQYQLIQAIQQLPNTLNDVEQVLNLTGTVFSIGLNLDLLPDKYICLARSAEAYVAGTVYTFKGSTATSYSFTAVNPFLSGDDVLLVIDHSTVRAYNITIDSTVTTEAFTPFGMPVAFNDSGKIWYQSEGVLFNDQPKLADLQQAIRVAESDGTILVYEVVVINGFVLCLSFVPGILTYTIYKFAISSLATPVAMTFVGSGLPTGVITIDYQPNIYTDGEVLYISNAAGTNAHDYTLIQYNVDMVAGTLTNVGSIDLDHSFQKTTNAVINAGYLYTFIAGTIQQYNLGNGVKTFGASFPTFIGVIFGYNGGIWYSNGEVAKRWTLPVYV